MENRMPSIGKYCQRMPQSIQKPIHLIESNDKKKQPLYEILFTSLNDTNAKKGVAQHTPLSHSFLIKFFHDNNAFQMPSVRIHCIYSPKHSSDKSIIHFKVIAISFEPPLTSWLLTMNMERKLNRKLRRNAFATRVKTHLMLLDIHFSPPPDHF